MVAQMSRIAVIAVLVSFSVARRLKITSFQRAAAAHRHEQRDENQRIQHSNGANGSRGKWIFNCSGGWYDIELQNREIEKYSQHLQQAKALRETWEKEVGLPKLEYEKHIRLPKPEDEYYMDYQHLGPLRKQVDQGVVELRQKLAKEKGKTWEFFCWRKSDILKCQSRLLAKYSETIKWNKKIIRSFQSKVIGRQRTCIEKREAMLSRISSKEEQFGIEPPQSGEQQAQVEVAWRDSLNKAIQSLQSATADIHDNAPPSNDDIGKRTMVIHYQREVIGKYEQLLIVSFARLKERSGPISEITNMQVALENLLKADVKKMEVSMNLHEPTSMPTATNLLKPVLKGLPA